MERNSSIRTTTQAGAASGLELKPGASRSEELDLRPLFELKRGLYKVVLSRDVGTSQSEVTLEATASFSVGLDACCEMKITSDPKQPGVIEITVSNLNQPLVRALQALDQYDLKTQVISESGREADLTELGARMRRRVSQGARILRELKTGESFSQQVDLRERFELRSATTCDVIVSRGVIIDGSNVALPENGKLRMP
jgi:hypothetical protein